MWPAAQRRVVLTSYLDRSWPACGRRLGYCGSLGPARSYANPLQRITLYAAAPLPKALKTGAVRDASEQQVHWGIYRAQSTFPQLNLCVRDGGWHRLHVINLLSRTQSGKSPHSIRSRTQEDAVQCYLRFDQKIASLTGHGRWSPGANQGRSGTCWAGPVSSQQERALRTGLRF